MERVVIIGNSGSGKTTLARKVCDSLGCARLDLDDVAWIEASVPTRESIENSCLAIDRFMDDHERWVIEGCYATLIGHAAGRADYLFFINTGVGACVRNCERRPWEPSKFASKEIQDSFLPGLIDWVKTYETRDDEFGFSRHWELFQAFRGVKREIRSATELESIALTGSKRGFG